MNPGREHRAEKSEPYDPARGVQRRGLCEALNTPRYGARATALIAAAMSADRGHCVSLRSPAVSGDLRR
jgi:hypothetical protein